MQTRKVRKAVIPAAGHGTRFMPITKSVPKEMLVLVDKPAIHYIVEECAESGIEEVAIIVSRGKEAIERYFTPALNDTPELKALLKKIKITFITQETLNGTGGAILLTKDFVGDEPFAVLFGDDVVVNDVPCIKQLIDAYDKTGKTVYTLYKPTWEGCSCRYPSNRGGTARGSVFPGNFSLQRASSPTMC